MYSNVLMLVYGFVVLEAYYICYRFYILCYILGLSAVYGNYCAPFLVCAWLSKSVNVTGNKHSAWFTDRPKGHLREWSGFFFGRVGSSASFSGPRNREASTERQKVPALSYTLRRDLGGMITPQCGGVHGWKERKGRGERSTGEKMNCRTDAP